MQWPIHVRRHGPQSPTWPSTWDEGKLWQQEELDEIVTVGNGNGITIQQEGNAPRVLEQRTDVTAEYRTPFAVQASLEPQAAAAEVLPDRVRVWVSTQMHERVRPTVAEALGVDEEIVEIIPTYIGGGFGRKSGFEVAVEAARLSQAAGVPVHVGWDRTEEMRDGYFRPPTHHKLYAALDDSGRIEAMEHRQASGDVAFDFLPGIMATVMGADFGAYRGATIRYAVPNRKTIAWRTALTGTHGLVARSRSPGQYLRAREFHGRSGPGGWRGSAAVPH